MPATIDDPAILDEIKQDLKDNNILKSLRFAFELINIFPSDITNIPFTIVPTGKPLTL